MPDDVVEARRQYLLAELRCALLRARLLAVDIEAIGLALRGGLITADQACDLLSDCDVLRLLGIAATAEASS
jgi:hypothetical protein